MVKERSYKDLDLDSNGIHLIQGDSLTAIQKLQDESVDLTITSPPYFIGKEYDSSKSIDDFIELHTNLLEEVVRVTKNGGSICWQTGYHTSTNSVIPLDYIIYDLLRNFEQLNLKNRIIWTFGHGLHSKKRFSGRHEVILWFVKGKEYTFNLDDIRVPQKYPGKRHYKGDKKGQYSGNPLGKNPSDIWSIPNVKANHVEKTQHPCQFPVALVQRLVLGLTNKNDLVLDPFMGVGSTGVACALENRRFIGMELDKDYFNIAKVRCSKAIEGDIQIRPLNKPVYTPNKNTAVASKPEHFKF